MGLGEGEGFCGLVQKGERVGRARRPRAPWNVSVRGGPVGRTSVSSSFNGRPGKKQGAATETGTMCGRALPLCFCLQIFGTSVRNLGDLFFACNMEGAQRNEMKLTFLARINISLALNTQALRPAAAPPQSWRGAAWSRDIYPGNAPLGSDSLVT